MLSRKSDAFLQCFLYDAVFRHFGGHLLNQHLNRRFESLYGAEQSFAADYNCKLSSKKARFGKLVNESIICAIVRTRVQEACLTTWKRG